MSSDNNLQSNSKYEFLSRNIVVSNSKFNVFYDHLITLEGEDIEDFIVIKPKKINSQNIVGICVLPIYQDNFFLMRGWRHQFDDFIYQAPTGFIESNESVRESSRRELYEETSFICEPKNMIPLGKFLPDAGLIEGYIALYLALNCQISDVKISNEIGTGELFPLSKEDLIQLINKEENIGGSTLVTCFRALNYLEINQIAN